MLQTSWRGLDGLRGSSSWLVRGARRGTSAVLAYSASLRWIRASTRSEPASAHRWSAYPSGLLAGVLGEVDTHLRWSAVGIRVSARSRDRGPVAGASRPSSRGHCPPLPGEVIRPGGSPGKPPPRSQDRPRRARPTPDAAAPVLVDRPCCSLTHRRRRPAPRGGEPGVVVVGDPGGISARTCRARTRTPSRR